MPLLNLVFVQMDVKTGAVAVVVAVVVVAVVSEFFYPSVAVVVSGVFQEDERGQDSASRSSGQRPVSRQL